MYKEALKHDPDNPDLYYNLGVVAIEQGNPKQGNFINIFVQPIFGGLSWYICTKVAREREGTLDCLLH